MESTSIRLMQKYLLKGTKGGRDTMTQEEYDNDLGLYKTLSKEVGRLRWKLFIFRITYLFKHEKWKIVRLLSKIIVIAFLFQVLVLNNIEKQIIKLPGSTKIVYVQDSTKTFTAFLDKVGELESGGKYSIISKFGYLGKYQIGRLALRDIGMGGIPTRDFLETPALQEIAMLMLLRKNKKYLQSHIGKYNSKKVKGLRIDESSLLAAAHLTGAGSVIQFLDSNGEIDPVDGNGIKTSSRIKLFAGYKLDL